MFHRGYLGPFFNWILLISHNIIIQLEIPCGPKTFDQQCLSKIYLNNSKLFIQFIIFNHHVPVPSIHFYHSLVHCTGTCALCMKYRKYSNSSRTNAATAPHNIPPQCAPQRVGIKDQRAAMNYSRVVCGVVTFISAGARPRSNFRGVQNRSWTTAGSGRAKRQLSPRSRFRYVDVVVGGSRDRQRSSCITFAATPSRQHRFVIATM